VKKRSPTALTLELYRSSGWECDISEYWNAFARKRKDLFGFIDVVAVTHGTIVGIQTTTYSNRNARKNKILTECNVAAYRWLQAGGEIHIVSWKQLKEGRKTIYAADVMQITEADFAEAWA